MDQISILIKAFIIGITGTTMPLTVLLYLAYSSIKNGGKIGKSLFTGHLLVEITLIVLTFVGASFILESVWLQIITSLASCVICIGYGAILSKETVSLIKYNKNDDTDNDIDYQMSDIYSYNEDEAEDEEDKKSIKWSGKAMTAGVLLSASNLAFISFISISVPAMTFQTNLSFGGNVDFLTTLLFLIVFILGEFILYIFLPKIIAIVRRWVDNKIMPWITGSLAIGFFIISITSFFEMMGGFKFV